MSYIYRYKLRNKYDREYVNLVKYKGEIEYVINNIFKDNLEIEINEKYFEFRSNEKIQTKYLRMMGKDLKDKIRPKESIRGFTRSSIDYIASVNKQTEDYIEFDLIEYSDLIKSLEMYKSIKLDKDEHNNVDRNQSYKINKEKRIAEIINQLDIFNLTIKRNLLDKIGVEVIGNEHYLIMGINRQRENDECILERDFKEFYHIDNKDELKDFLENKKYDERLSILEFKKYNEEEIKEGIKELFNVDNFTIEEFNDELMYDKLKTATSLKIINVGQGLSNALCDNKNNPLLYLDIGTGCGINKCTTPQNLEFNLKKKPIIILSHIDEDHWSGVRIAKDSLDMIWVAPKQSTNNKKRIIKLYSELHSRGNLYYINNDIILTNVNDYINEFVIFKGNGPDVNVHNNSTNLYINSIKNKKILLCSDTRYEYINKIYAEDINILCASHHGGEYTGNKLGNIPKCAICNKIVYSYGKHEKFNPDYNSHKHPSKKSDYRSSGWNKEYDTPNGDYNYKFGNCIYNGVNLCDGCKDK